MARMQNIGRIYLVNGFQLVTGTCYVGGSIKSAT
jgi:hypothetical protein